MGGEQLQIFKSTVEELNARIVDELEARILFCVTDDEARYLRGGEDILNTQVQAALPELIFDLNEARKCMGLGRYTAAVFHLMRAMESSVIKAGDLLGVTVTNKEGGTLPWGIILANMKAATDVKPKGENREKWNAIHAHLYAVKEAWRNNTMHPKQTYTAEEAGEIFGAAKSFIRRLSDELA